MAIDLLLFVLYHHELLVAADFVAALRRNLFKSFGIEQNNGGNGFAFDVFFDQLPRVCPGEVILSEG